MRLIALFKMFSAQIEKLEFRNSVRALALLYQQSYPGRHAFSRRQFGRLEKN